MRLWKNSEIILQFVILAVTVLFVFEWLVGNPSKFFYLPFLPLIWIALRGGLPGAAMASIVIQIGVVLGAHGGAIQMVALVELQALVMALTLTGLFLGVTVDERERAIEEREQALRGLEQSLRLAAAGEMAGAIAHEINQPLAALTNYGRAGQIMLKRSGEKIASAEMQIIIDKMFNESKRAAEVIGRLRDFFRTGTTRLELVRVNSLLEGIRNIGSKLCVEQSVSFEVENGWDDSPLLIDRLQIELILRNLLSNAVEAVINLPIEKRCVTVKVQKMEDNGLLLRVIDTGLGIKASMCEQVFKPFVSNKSTGMGLGLAISRDIAETHGGSLTVVPGNYGEFRLLLPGEKNNG